MPSTISLTIGVPTYNRPAHVDRLVAELVGGEIDDLQLLIVDDGGAGGAFELLSKKYGAKKNVRILKNERNLGYSATLLRIFEECQTDYLMMMADDDVVLIDQVPSIARFLLKHSPDFVSPQFMIGQQVYRGSSETRPIEPEEFFPASAHAPGLIYKVAACRSGLEALTRRIALKSAEGLVYPQILLLASLIAGGGSCYWLAVPSVSEGSAEASGIRDQQGRVYWSFESRWGQLTGFDNFLADLIRGAEKPAEVKKMIAANASRAFGHLLDAMQTENPALRAEFDRRGRVFYVKQWLKLGISRILPKLLSARLLD